MDIYLLATVIVAGGLLRARYLDFPLDDDFGFSAYPAFFRHKGVRLIKDYFICFPHLWVYSFVFKVFGRSPRAVRLFDYCVESLIAVLIWTFAHMAGHGWAGVTAAAFYLFSMNSATIAFFSGAQERYFGVVSAGGFLLLLMGLLMPEHRETCIFLSGMVFGLNAFYKDVLLLEPALAGAALLFAGGGFSDALLLAGGYLFVYSAVHFPVVRSYAGFGEYFRLLRFAYNRAFQDNADRGSLRKLLLNFWRFFKESAPIWTATAASALLASLGAEPVVIVAVAWLLSTGGIFFVQRVYWPYHFIPLAAPLSLIAGLAVYSFVNFPPPLSTEAQIAVMAIFAGSCLLALWTQLADLLKPPTPEAHAGKLTESKLEQLMVVPRIAEYIKARTSSGDYIYQWGYLYHLYMLAERLCPVRGAISLRPPALAWKVEALSMALEGLRNNPPKYLVVHLQALDFDVLKKLSGLTFELEKVFGTGLRLYRLVGSHSEKPPLENLTEADVEALLASADHPYLKAMEACKNGTPRLAREHLAEALRLNPAHLGALFLKAELLMADEKPLEAISIFRSLAEWEDMHTRVNALLRLLDIYSARRIFPELEHAALALEREGEKGNPATIYRLAAAYSLLDMRERALNVLLSQKVASHPFDGRAFAVSNYFNAAKILYGMKRFAEARDQLDKCLALEPGHRAAANLLDDVSFAADPFPPKEVVVFDCARDRDVDHCVGKLAEQYPACRITVLARRGRGGRFSSDPRVAETVEFPHHHFTPALLLLPAVRRLLARIKPDVAAIPETAANFSQALIEYGNVLLYSARLSPKKTFFYQREMGVRRETSISLWPAFFARKLREAFLLPFWVVADLWRLWKRADRDDVIALIKEPNDMLAHHVKTQWIKRNGLYGVEFNSYMGNPYMLYYPPLSLWLLGKLGSIRFLSLEIFLFSGVMTVAAALSGNWWALALVPFIAISDYFRVISIYVGRLDFLAWGFVFAAMTAFHAGHPAVAGVLFGLAVLSHTTTATLGSAGFLGLAVIDGIVWPGLFIAASAGMAVSAVWWAPFLRNRGKFGFHKIWSGIVFWQNVYRAYRVPFNRLTVFLAVALLADGLKPMFLLLLIPWGILVFGLARGKYIFHAVNINGAVVTFGAFAVCAEPAPVTALLFVVLVNYLGGMDSPRILPMFAKPIIEEAKPFFAAVRPGERVALECGGDTYWDDNLSWGWLFNLVANDRGFHLLSGVGFDQVDPVLPLEVELKINAATDGAELARLLRRGGSAFVAAYTDGFSRSLESQGYAKIAVKKFLGAGFLQGREWRLFRAPFAVSLIDPPAEVALERNAIRFTPDGAREYLLKFAYYPGWRATQGGAELEIRDAAPGMALAVNGKEEVKLTFNPGLLG